MIFNNFFDLTNFNISDSNIIKNFSIQYKDFQLLYKSYCGDVNSDKIDDFIIKFYKFVISSQHTYCMQETTLITSSILMLINWL